jgi:hypothetical protein
MAEEPDVEHGKLELDVAEVTGAIGQALAAIVTHTQPLVSAEQVNKGETGGRNLLASLASGYFVTDSESGIHATIRSGISQWHLEHFAIADSDFSG